MKTTTQTIGYIITTATKYVSQYDHTTRTVRLTATREEAWICPDQRTASKIAAALLTAGRQGVQVFLSIPQSSTEQPWWVGVQQEKTPLGQKTR